MKLTLNDPKETSVLGCTGTWLNKDVSDTEVQISGYKFVARWDRVHNTWGGGAMYVNESLTCDEHDDVRHKDLEAIWIQTTYPSSPPILVTNVNCPPDSPVKWYDIFIEICDKAYAEEKEMILIGDINLDFLKPQHLHQKWTSIMEYYNITELIKEPTRIAHNSKTCLHHIYETNNEHLRATKVSKMGLSDHLSSCYTWKHNSQYLNKTHTTMKCSSFREFDTKLFVEDLEHVP